MIFYSSGFVPTLRVAGHGEQRYVVKSQSKTYCNIQFLTTRVL